jgi:hypothetical protein
MLFLLAPILEFSCIHAQMIIRFSVKHILILEKEIMTEYILVLANVR